MIKIGLLALTGTALTFASAKAIDNSASANAAVAFGQFGLSGLAVAGRAPDSYGYPPFGPTIYAPVGQPEYVPICWTQYVTISNGNTLVNLPHTICR